jgi:hypothetical protein
MLPLTQKLNFLALGPTNISCAEYPPPKKKWFTGMPFHKCFGENPEKSYSIIEIWKPDERRVFNLNISKVFFCDLGRQSRGQSLYSCLLFTPFTAFHVCRPF